MKKALILMLIVLSIFGFLACSQPHEHTFDYSKWVYDSECHWHPATCEHSDKIENKIYHSFNNEVTVAPTHTTTGVRTYTCITCGYSRTETIPADTSNHTWDAGVVTLPATCTEAGEKTITCTVCGNTKTESIAALGHDYSSEWTVDDSETCTEAGSKSHHCSRCSSKADVTVLPAAGHSYDDGAVTTAAGCTTTGVKTFTCANCGDTYTEDIPATGHAYSSDWSSNATHHWHAATCEHTEETKSYGTHSFPTKATAVLQEDGTYKFEKKCTVCGYSVVVPYANVGDIGPAGGNVFYDKGEYSDGWRFLEVPNVDIRVVLGVPTIDYQTPGYSTAQAFYVFGFYRTSADGPNLYTNGTTSYNSADCTGTAVGTGKANTELLVSSMGDIVYSDASGITKTSQYAAKLCADLEYKGFDDWFLPSYGELLLIRKAVFDYGLDSNKFAPSDYRYWSSSEVSTSPNNAVSLSPVTSHAISEGSREGYSKVFVRPIRQF